MQKLLLLTDFYGDEDEPLDGKNAWLCKQLLSQVGVDYGSCDTLSVINRRVPNEYALRANKAGGLPGVWQKPHHVSKAYAEDVSLTETIIKKRAPNCILALGSLPTWFLLGSGAVKSVRGALTATRVGIKAIVTHSMQDVFRDWTLRPIVLSDMHKAGREAKYPEIIRPARHVHIRPTLADLATFEESYINDAPLLSIDIETTGDRITCIGFAPSTNLAIVIPFHSAEGSYWPSLAEELEAWNYVRRWCLKPALFQNGLYDIQFLWRRYGIQIPNAVEDTMLLHHAMQPEMNKGLGFLGSLYTDEASWKFMRKAKHD